MGTSTVAGGSLLKKQKTEVKSTPYGVMLPHLQMAFSYEHHPKLNLWAQNT